MVGEQESPERNDGSEEIPPELLAEFEAWERASDEAWQGIDQLEKQEGFDSW